MTTTTTIRATSTVQNKMHWAAHGRTAAEVIASRASVAKSHMGLTTWKKAPTGPVRKPYVAIAKNYLNADELDALNRIRRNVRPTCWVSRHGLMERVQFHEIAHTLSRSKVPVDLIQ